MCLRDLTVRVPVGILLAVADAGIGTSQFELVGSHIAGV